MTFEEWNQSTDSDFLDSDEESSYSTAKKTWQAVVNQCANAVIKKHRNSPNLSVDEVVKTIKEVE